MKTIQKLFIVVLITLAIPFSMEAQCWFSQLVDDISKSSDSDFASLVRNNDDAFVAYEIVYNARGANALMKTDPDLLREISVSLNDALFMERIGGQEGLEAIIQRNVKAPCSTCGNTGAAYLKNIDLYIKDVRHFVNNYADVPGAIRVINDLKTGGVNTVEGTAFMLRVLENNPNRYLGKITKFEGSIDDLQNGCRYDILLDDGNKLIFGEFKSYSSMGNFLNPGSDTYQQFTTYWGSINSIDQLHYYFDINKIEDINIIKNRIKTIFQNNSDEMFNLMKPELKESLDISATASYLNDSNLNEIVNIIIKLE